MGEAKDYELNDDEVQKILIAQLRQAADAAHDRVRIVIADKDAKNPATLINIAFVELKTDIVRIMHGEMLYPLIEP